MLELHSISKNYFLQKKTIFLLFQNLYTVECFVKNYLLYEILAKFNAIKLFYKFHRYSLE